MSATYRFVDQIASRSDPAFHALLAEQHRAGVRPLCLCTPDGVMMYIARTGDNYSLKRMPGSGKQHHADCPSFEMPEELSGRGKLQASITEDAESGLTTLKLDFSLTKREGGRAPSAAGGETPIVAEADPAKLTLRALLHLLYDDAQLNRWVPAMEGHRSWKVVRKHLLSAAAGKVTRSSSLAEALLIPETFNLERKDVLAAGQRKHFAQFKGGRNPQKLGIIVGELKDFKAARYGKKMLLKHMPDSPIYLDDDLYAKIERAFDVELAYFRELEDIHLLVICTHTVAATGSPQAKSLAVMMLDARWLPFENIEEKDLVDRLCSDSRRFIKSLRYNLKASQLIAAALLTDTEGGPTAVYVIPPHADDDYHAELDALIESSEIQHCIIDAVIIGRPTIDEQMTTFGVIFSDRHPGIVARGHLLWVDTATGEKRWLRRRRERY